LNDPSGTELKLGEASTYSCTFTPDSDYAKNYNAVTRDVNITFAKEGPTKLSYTGTPKTVYYSGEKFDPSGLTFTIKYNKKASKTIEAPYEGIHVSPDTLKKDDTSVTLSYTENGMTASCMVGITVSLRPLNMSNVKWDKENLTYTKSGQTVKLEGLPPGVTVKTITGNSETNAGTHTATITFEYDTENCVLTGCDSAGLTLKEGNTFSKDWSIDKQKLDMSNVHWTAGSFQYNGSERTVVLDGLPDDVTANYTDNKGTAVGEYTAKVTFEYDTKNFELSNTPAGINSHKWSISYGTINMSGVKWETENFTYDGKPHKVELDGLPDGVTANYKNNEQTDAGDYEATVEFTSNNPNYTLTAIPEGISTHSWSIARLPLDLTGVFWSDGSFTYDGEKHGLSLNGVGNLPKGVEIKDFDGYEGTDADKYTASVTFICTDDQNYTLQVLDGGAVTTKTEWTLRKDWSISAKTLGLADLPDVAWDVKEYVYNGNPQGPTLKGTDTLPKGVKVTPAGNSATDAGTYTASVTFGFDNAKNYILDENVIESLKKTWSIAKQPLNLDNVKWEVGEYTYTGNPQGPTLSGVPNPLPQGVTMTTPTGDTATDATSTTESGEDYTASVTFTWNDNYVYEKQPDTNTLTIEAPWRIEQAIGTDDPEYEALENVHIITNIHPTLQALEDNWLKDKGWLFAEEVDKTKKLSYTENDANQKQTFRVVYTPENKNYAKVEVEHPFPVTKIELIIEGGINMLTLDAGTSETSSVNLTTLGAPLKTIPGNPFSADNLKWETDLDHIATVKRDETVHTNATISAIAKGVTTVGVFLDVDKLRDTLLGYVLVKVTAPEGTSNDSSNGTSDFALLAENLKKAINLDSNVSPEDTKKHQDSVAIVANEVTELPDDTKAILKASDVETLDTLVRDVCNVETNTIVSKPSEGNENIPQPTVVEDVKGLVIAGMQDGKVPQSVIVNVEPIPPTKPEAKMELSVTLSVDGKSQQPKSPLFFTIELPEGLEPDPAKLELRHIKDGVTIEKLDFEPVDNRKISFKMTSLSEVQFVPIVNATPAPEPEKPEPVSGGGSGGSGAASYRISVREAEHGTVRPGRTSASFGSTVILSVEPDEGYVLETITASGANRTPIRINTANGSQYNFVMPSENVTVIAAFKPSAKDTTSAAPAEPEASGSDGGENCPSTAFTDLNTQSWYHEAVDYVLNEEMMNGVGNSLFRPDWELSRAMLVQILYNREGRPQVDNKTVFTDVPSDAWYADAVYWAAKEGIVTGYGGGRFRPEDPITREQLAVILCRYSGSPETEANAVDFSDASSISDCALEAIRWAVANEVIPGHTNGTLEPKGTATRTQTAQMLINLFNK